ncbi:MAG: choice-of-anchor L domain-containing protein, partial [Bacteroidia bacterium]|nr:choice-of-anchor L domain-containing protein [Bacteroidia bacterium]
MKKILSFVILLLTTNFVFGQLSVLPNQTATALANYLIGGGVVISNAQLTCPSGASGIFTNGSSTNLGLNNGVVLTTGQVSSIPNGNGVNASTNNGAGGIAQMAPLTGSSSNYDGCMLEFDITPHCSPLNIRYKFASEEYPEFVNGGYNDGFGFFITGPNPLGGNYTNLNLATVPGSSTPVTIDNINSSSNSAYYIANTGSTIVYDGMTTVLTGSANVTPCANYHLILAITDGGDAFYDSGVFLEQSGISCNSPTVNVSGATVCAGQPATLTATGATSYTWSTGSTSSSIVVTPTITTTYTVGGSNIGTCIQSSKVVTVTVNPAPTANAGPSRTLTCANTSTTLAGSGGGTYSWSGPGIVSGGSSSTPTINQPGTYTLIVTSSGCPSLPSVVTVTQNTTAPTAGASNSSTLTCTTRTIGISGTGGGTYAWSGPGIVSGGSTATPSVNLPGTYVVTVTAANGCTATANTSVTQNTTAPTANAVNSGSLNCTNTTVTLTASGGGTYSWTGGAITGNTSANPTVNAGGTYSVLVTAANGCTATANT